MPPFRYGQEAVRRTGALMASIATLIVPSVPFLKPTDKKALMPVRGAPAIRWYVRHCAPAHQVSEILWGDHIEKLTAAGRPLSLISSSNLRAIRRRR